MEPNCPLKTTLIECHFCLFIKLMLSTTKKRNYITLDLKTIEEVDNVAKKYDYINYKK